MSYVSHLEMRFSGARQPADRPASNTATDGDLLEVRYDIDRVRRSVPRDTIAMGPSTLWRYAAMLPATKPDDAVTLGEGWTPLLRVPALGRSLGLISLYIKDEGRNPSGTFKDRGASVAATCLRELGVSHMIHNSSGNAAGSWAMYAARGGLHCINIVPEDVLTSSVQQSTLAGADTYVLQAGWHTSGGIVREAAAANGWFNIGTLREPYRLEGKKTMGYEICEQLGWELPDVVVYPTGGALGAIAIFKAFDELIALGWVQADRKPRLIVTQYEGCAPIVEAYRAGEDRAKTWSNITSLPGGLKSAAPLGDRAVLKIVRESGGTAITVSNEEALDGVARITKAEGIFPCPESATTLVGLEKAVAAGQVRRDERIVLVSTGSGLKSTAVLPGADRMHPIRAAGDIRGSRNS
jgi:threonine synthase